VKLWDLEAEKELRQFTLLADRSACVAFSPDSRRILAADKEGDKGFVHVWEVQGGKELARLGQHDGDIAFVSYMPGEQQVLTAGVSDAIKVWDAQSGELLRSSPVDNDGELFRMSKDGKLAVRCNWASMLLWDVEAGKEAKRLQVKSRGNAIVGVAFSPDGRKLIWIDNGGQTALTDVSTGETVWTKCLTYLERAILPAFSSDGRLIDVKVDGKVLDLLKLPEIREQAPRK
jgi:WD40 repeat protein